MDIKLPFLKQEEPKLFEIHRQKDYKKISGIGHVIDGIIFPDGTTVIRWRSKYSSTCVFESYGKFKRIHLRGHESDVIWVEKFKEKNNGKKFSIFRNRRKSETSVSQSSDNTESDESTPESDDSLTKT